MSEWFWVFLGFAITYGSIIGYFVVLQRRRTVVRQLLESLR